MKWIATIATSLVIHIAVKSTVSKIAMATKLGKARNIAQFSLTSKIHFNFS